MTDHGCVQAFPDANHAVEKGDGFKVLYGVEGYLVDDMKQLAENETGQSLDHTCVVFDIETTGFSPIKNKIIEIGAVKVENGKNYRQNFLRSSIRKFRFLLRLRS